MEIAPESRTIERARKKLEAQFAAQQINPTELGRVAEITRRALASGQVDRVAVPGKKSLALFATNQDIAPVSTAVQALFERLRNE